MDFYMAAQVNPLPGISTFGCLTGAKYGDDKLDAMVDSQYKINGNINVFGFVEPPVTYENHSIRHDEDGEPGFSVVARSVQEVFEFYGIVYDERHGWGTVVHYNDPAGKSNIDLWWWQEFIGSDGLDYSWFVRKQAETGVELCDVNSFFNALTHVAVDTSEVYHSLDELVDAVGKRFKR